MNLKRLIVMILLLAAGTGVLQSGDGKHAGRIGSVKGGPNEIIVNMDGGTLIKMGDILYVRSGESVIVMEATFPMQTIVKCRIQKKYAKYFRSIVEGMDVYRYDRTVIESRDETDASAVIQERIGNIDMVSLPRGTFMMGSEDGKKDERPIHRVTVDRFYIGKYEVTQGQYNEIMGVNPSKFRGNDSPVENVSWDDAVEFCRKFSVKYNVKARLPYEAEWEYACRSGTTSKYYWGNDINGDYCWYDANSPTWSSGRVTVTHPAGKKKPNAFGLYDMSGNVWEWCMDWYSDSYYSKSPSRNPQGAQDGGVRVTRGGATFTGPDFLRSALRGGFAPYMKTPSVGFRIVVIPE